MPGDALDVPLIDEELLSETTLTVDLMIAVSDCPEDFLWQERIDAILGVGTVPARAGRNAA